MGASIFWPTAERLSMSSFMSPISIDLMYLFVPKPKVDDSLWAQVSKPFAPFTGTVWFSSLSIIVLTGILQRWLTSRLWWSDWAANVGWEGSSRSRKLRLLLSTMLSEGIYYQFMMVISGGIEYDNNHRVATQLLNVGFGFFVMLFLSAYTANLAAFLSSVAISDYWSDVYKASEGAAALGGKVCAHTVLRNRLEKAYPRVNFHFRYMDGYDDLLDALTHSKCLAFIMSMRAMKVEVATERLRCERGFVATSAPVAEVDVALPAQPEVADAMSFWMQNMADLNATTYSTIQQRYESDVQCAMHPIVGEVGDMMPLDIQDFAVPLTIAATFIIASITVRLSRQAVTRTITETNASNLAKDAPEPQMAAVALQDLTRAQEGGASPPAGSCKESVRESEGKPNAALSTTQASELARIGANVEKIMAMLANDGPRVGAAMLSC